MWKGPVTKFPVSTVSARGPARPLFSPKRFTFIPVDYALFGYLAFLTLSILLFHSRLSHWGWFLVFHGAVAGLAVFLAATLDTATDGWRGLLRWGYPILLFTFFYEECGYLLHLFSDRWFDPAIVGFEYRLTGTFPSVWLARHARPWLTEIVMAGYFSYYFIIPLGAILLWAARKPEHFKRMVLSVSIGFFISYVGFILFPVEGPRFFFPQLHPPPVEGPVFYQLVKIVMDAGAIHGGCMPSSHVAVAVLVLMSLFRGARRWFWLLLPLVAGLAVGTVYGRFHYASDVAAGLAVAPAAFQLANRWLIAFNNQAHVS